MKTKLASLLLGLALLAWGVPARAQNITINLSGNGVLTATNLNPGSTCSVQWASSLSGPWTNWASAVGRDALIVSNNGTVTLTVPMFYRVLGDAATNSGTGTNSGGTAPAGMAVIPAGSFTMGDTLDGLADATPTNIYVSQFYMDTNLVTYALWQSVYSYATSHGYSFANAGSGIAANHPVQTVDWFDCVKWSNARSAQAGLTPVYYTDAGFTRVFTNGDFGTTVYQNLAAQGYRLPTEAEWEKAARGGLSGQRFPWGNTISESQANYFSSSSYSYDLSNTGYNPTYATGAYSYTSPVGSFAPNGYGLNDMAGNEWEWCWDWYGTPYGQPSTNNPTGVNSSSGYRVLRGGSWNNLANFARCAYRVLSSPDSANYLIGFRCVRGL